MEKRYLYDTIRAIQKYAHALNPRFHRAMLLYIIVCFRQLAQLGSCHVEKGEEELEPWVRAEMDRCMTEIWLTGDAELFSQLFYFISSENVSGELAIRAFFGTFHSCYSVIYSKWQKSFFFSHMQSFYSELMI